jgi:hypothetical protein
MGGRYLKMKADHPFNYPTFAHRILGFTITQREVGARCEQIAKAFNQE